MRTTNNMSAQMTHVALPSGIQVAKNNNIVTQSEDDKQR